MAVPRTLVIAGTDTGVGKTWVGCALARALRARGRRVVAVKPFETGCAAEPSAEEDGVLLAAATGQREPRRALVCLPAPVAPPEAADRAGRVLDLDVVLAQIHAVTASSEVALVEGAGGLMTPLTWGADLLDLARELRAPLLLVAVDRLGVIHHTRAAHRVSSSAGAELLGIVLGAPVVPDASTGSNAAALARLLPGTRLLAVPRAVETAVARAAIAPLLGWLGLE